MAVLSAMCMRDMFVREPYSISMVAAWMDCWQATAATAAAAPAPPSAQDVVLVQRWEATKGHAPPMWHAAFGKVVRSPRRLALLVDQLEELQRATKKAPVNEAYTVVVSAVAWDALGGLLALPDPGLGGSASLAKEVELMQRLHRSRTLDPRRGKNLLPAAAPVLDSPELRSWARLVAAVRDGMLKLLQGLLSDVKVWKMGWLVGLRILIQGPWELQGCDGPSLGSFAEAVLGLYAVRGTRCAVRANVQMCKCAAAALCR